MKPETFKERIHGIGKVKIEKGFCKKMPNIQLMTVVRAGMIVF